MDDATAVVTGASRGIGRAVARRFAEAGAHVVICGRDQDAIEAVAEELAETDGTVTAMRADVRDEFDVERVMQRADREGGEIAYVVACAGTFHGEAGQTPLSSESYAAFDDHVRSNARGVFATIREAIPHLAADARILVPVGPFDEQTPPGYGSYGVSKAAAAAVARAFAGELDAAVGLLDSGQTATAFDGAGDVTDGEGHDPGDAAELFYWAATAVEADELDGERLTWADWRAATE